MNILVVSQCFYPDDFRINDIVKSLVLKGHSVRVLTGLPDYAESKIPKAYRFFKKRREEWNGAEIIRVPTVCRRKGIIFRALNYLSFVISGWFYARFCHKNIDVVFSYQTSPVLQAIPAVTYKKRAGVPLILYCLDLWPESLKAWNISERHPLFKTMKGVSCRIYNQCDTVAVTSKPFTAYLRDVNGVPEEKIVYMPQHAEDLYADISGLYEDNGCMDFVFAGNIGAVQNIDCILYAASKMKTALPFRIHIIGNGSCFEQCKQLAEQIGVSDYVIFHGKHPQSEMKHFYLLADCFLLTLRGGDFIGLTLPAKLQGYMSVGKPVIAAADGAVKEIIKESECGLCVAAGDSDKLAEAMLKVMKQYDTFKDKGKNGRLYYEKHFTNEIFIDNLLALLSSANRE